MTVATTSPMTAPRATSHIPASIAPQVMPATNSAPVNGLSWNMTCPAPRSAVSTNPTALFRRAESVQPVVIACTLTVPSRSHLQWG